MNKEQKAERVAQIAEAIRESEAVFAVDYRGISVPQAAELRTKLIEAGARFSVVKNTLTERAVDDVGADTLKEYLEGPTAFTFVSAEGDIAMAAKALSQFRRANEVLEFKGGIMNGEPLSIEQIESLAKLPAVDVLHGQMVGVLASPITGLVRGLNGLISGLAIALGQIQAEGKVGGDEEPPAEAPGDPVAAGQRSLRQVPTRHGRRRSRLVQHRSRARAARVGFGSRDRPRPDRGQGRGRRRRAAARRGCR